MGVEKVQLTTGATVEQMKAAVAAKFQVDPDEVVLREDHKVVIDRRKRYPNAEPMVVGEWR